MFNYIDDSVKIDFDVPKDILKLMKECEEFDKEDRYACYMNYVEFLTDTICKEAYVQGHLKKQWETIERRFKL